MRFTRPAVITAFVGVAVAALATASPAFAGTNFSYLGQFTKVSTVSSTVPSNGDLNPYGVAVVHHSVGALHRGDVLVSNFNDSANNQGTGSTIVEIGPTGTQQLFATVPNPTSGAGLTTALAILPHGVVVVGSLPTNAGTLEDPGSAGALVFLNSDGQVITTMTGGDINGPWDLTAVSHGDFSAVFFTNVLNGGVIASGSADAGTVVRLDLDLRGGFPHVVSKTIIGSQFPEQTSSTALIVGPTGVGLGHSGTLYVADTVDNTIQAIPNALHRHSSALKGFQVSATSPAKSHLNGPLGLAIAPNGDILTVNGLDGFIVETTPFGKVVNAQLLDNVMQAPPLPTTPGFGSLFGLAVAPHHGGVYFVDDNENALNLLGRM